MSEPIKVSVILTSYNHAKYLREAIESVLGQTYANFELIIWDDHSEDASWEIINEYSDPRIKAFRNEERKRGIWGINKAIAEVAQGEYIAIHHSDDVWEPQKLEKQVVFLEEHPEIGAVFSQALIIGENGESFEDISHPYHGIFEQPNRSRHEWLNFFFYSGNALCHPSVLVRKICYDDCGLYRYGFAQFTDFDMWVRLCLKYEIHVLPEKLVKFRVRANEMNVSGNRPDARIRMQFEFLQIFNNYKSIETSEELIKVFPTANKYSTGEGCDIDFALAMVALEPDTFNTAKLFGLQLLFEALINPERARKIKELYGFSHSDFIALTAKNDVFSIEQVAALSVRVAALSARVAALSAQVAALSAQAAEKEQVVQSLTAQLTGILNSKAWKFALFLRQIRVKLLHPGSRREKLMRWLYLTLQVWRRKV